MIINPNYANKIGEVCPGSAGSSVAADRDQVLSSYAASLQDSVVPSAAKPNKRAEDGLVLDFQASVWKYSGQYASDSHKRDNWVGEATLRALQKLRAGKLDLSAVRNPKAYINVWARNTLRSVIRAETSQAGRNRTPDRSGSFGKRSQPRPVS